MYLLVQRKDTFSYVDFIRGKYDLENKQYIISMFRSMTVDERKQICNEDFETCWNILWRCSGKGKRVAEFDESKQRFDTLKTGYVVASENSTEWFSLEVAMKGCENITYEPEWGFPKGRRNINERDMQTAFREFSEETGIPTDSIMLLSHKPFEETFNGTNGIRYRHIYFIAEIDPNSVTRLCTEEIRDCGWLTHDEVIEKVSDTIERVEMFKRVHRFVSESLAKENGL